MIDQIVWEGGFAVRAVCEILNVSRSGFYAWRDETETQREREDRAIVPLVCVVFWRHKRRYGARRIAEEPVARRGDADYDSAADHRLR